MIIKVLQQHIDSGNHMCAGCPIALACTEAGLNHPHVCGRTVSYFPDGYLREATLPQIAFYFVSDFDAGRPVQPFEFELPIL